MSCYKNNNCEPCCEDNFNTISVDIATDGTLTGSGSFSDPLGIDCTNATITWNAGTTATVTDNANGEATISLCDADKIVHFWSENGSIDINVTQGSSIINLQTHTFVDNGDGTYNIINPDGSVLMTITDTSISTITDLGDGTYIYADETAVQTIINTQASSNPYDNAASGLTSTFVQGAIDEVVTNINTVNLVDNGDGTWTFTKADGTTVTISDTTVTSMVEANPPATTANHSWTFTNETGATTTINEALTSIAHNAATNVLSYVDENGLTTNVNLPVSTLVDNGNGSFTYSTELGGTTTWNETTSTLVDTPGTSFTYTNEDGVATTVNYAETVTTLVDNTNGTFTYTSENGTVTIWSETTSTLVDNANGTYTFTNEDGTVTAIDTTATSNPFTPVPGLLASTDSQTAITEAALLATNVSLTNNADGTFTFSNAFGVGTIFDICTALTQGNCDISALETTTTLTDNGNGTLSYVDEDGVTTTLNWGSMSVAVLADNSLLFTNPDGSTVPYDETLTTITYAAGTNNITYTDESGAVTVLDLNESTLVDQGNGAYLYTNELGTTTAFNAGWTNVVNNADNSLTFTQPDGSTFNYDETLTSIAYNGGTGDLTYTDEAGTATVVNIPTENFLAAASYDNPTTTLTLTLTDATTFAVDLSALVATTQVAVTDTNCINLTLTGDGSTGTPYTIQADPILNPNADNILSCTATGLYATQTITTFVDNGNGTYTYTSENGTATTTAAAVNSISSWLGPINGVYTHDDGTGTTFNIDVKDGVSADAGNYLTLGADGLPLFGPTQFGAISIDALSDVDTTAAAPNNGEVLSWNGANWVPTAINQETTTVTDTQTVDLTLTGTAISADVILDPAINNLASSSAAGILATITVAGDLSGLGTAASPLTFTETTTSLTNLNNGSIRFTNEDGVNTDIDVCAVISSCGLDVLVDVDTTTTAPAINDVLTWNGTDWVPGGTAQTTTTLVDNANGTFTYTNEVGATTTFNSGATTATVNADNSVTFTYPNGTTQAYDETLTSLAFVGTILTYTDESGAPTALDLSTLFTCASLNTCSVDSLSDVDTTTAAPAVNQALIWNGTNWVPGAAGNTSIVTQTVLAGNQIGSHNDGTGTTVNLFETVTTLADLGTGSIRYTAEDGTTTDISICTTLNQCSVDALSDVDTTTTAPTTDDILKWDGTNWVPTSLCTELSNCRIQSSLGVTSNLAGSTGNTFDASTLFTLPATCTTPTYTLAGYDTTVLTNVSIDAAGVVTYDIIPGATIGDRVPLQVSVCC